MPTILRYLSLPMLLALALRGPVAADPNPKEEPVTPAAEAPARPAVPPIDAAAPAQFETATFALG